MSGRRILGVLIKIILRTTSVTTEPMQREMERQQGYQKNVQTIKKQKKLQQERLDRKHSPITE